MGLSITIDTRKPRQRLDHFGASGAWSLDPIGSAWSDAGKNRLADLLFSRSEGIGLSALRFNIGAGGTWVEDAPPDPWRFSPCLQRGPDASIDTQCHAGQRWFLRAARQRGLEKAIAFVNSPPIWLTVNGRARCDAATGSTNLKPGAEAAFAAFLARVLERFATDGLPFDGISPINEPNWGWEGNTQEGCRYSNDDIVRVVDALAAALSSRNLVAKIEAPESADLRFLLDDARYDAWAGTSGGYRHGMEAQGYGKCREQIRDLLSDPGRAERLGRRLCTHSYWTYDDPERSRTLREAVRANLDRVVGSGAELWQTEVCIMEPGRDLGMDTALRVARLIHQDLVHAEASAWSWWLAVSPEDYKDGLIYTDWRVTGEESILPSRTLWALGHFSRFLRPGAHRLTTSATEDDGLFFSAYRRATTDTLAVVMVNTADRERTVSVAADRPIAPWTPYTTDATQALTRGSRLEAGAIAVRPRSIVTLVESDHAER